MAGMACYAHIYTSSYMARSVHVLANIYIKKKWDHETSLFLEISLHTAVHRSVCIIHIAHIYVYICNICIVAASPIV